MSSKIKGLRRVGIVGLSTLVAASMMSLSAVTATALPPVYTALTAPNVTQGASSQLAGSLTLDLTNDFVTNAAQTFTIVGNDCSTATTILAATEFSALPTAALTGPFAAGVTTAGTATRPTFTTTLTSSSTQCATAGITDQVTLTLTSPSSIVGPTDWFKYTLSNVRYNVGSTDTAGPVTVVSAGTIEAAAPGTVTNAVVTVGSYTVIPVIAAQNGSDNNTMGTASLIETTAGAFFGVGANTVVLTLDTGAFTAGVTPTITVPAGYTATAPVLGASTFTFVVTAPATIALLVKATVTVSGLKFNASALADVTATLEASVDGASEGAMQAVNVLDFAARTGGSDRYGTAANLFSNGADTDAVLASGQNFPDALSANYLAGQLNTGTLLTLTSTLPTVTRAKLFSENIATVYIVGGPLAVSQAVQTQIEAMHVGNNPASAFITVVRLAGTNRYATNRVINEHTFVPKTTVMLATGENFADALTVGPMAAGRLLPLILTGGTTLGTNETTQLNDFNPTNVVIAGGTNVVSAAIATALTAQGYNVVRLSGQDRTQTAERIATWATDGIGTTGFLSTSLGFNSNTAYVTTGANYADALVGGPVAGALDSVILPSNSPTSLGAGIPLYLGEKTVGSDDDGSTIDTLHALGLTNAMSAAVMKAAAASIGYVAPVVVG